MPVVYKKRESAIRQHKGRARVNEVAVRHANFKDHGYFQEKKTALFYSYLAFKENA